MRFEAKKQLLETASGNSPADLVLKNATVADVFTGTVFHADVAIVGGRIAGVGSGYHGVEERDLSGHLVAPGFIDAHMHLESSMARPAVVGSRLLPLGTTAVVADPHEIANVAGLAGVRYMMADAEKSPADLFFALPSCVPLGDRERGGAVLSAADLAVLLDDPRVVALGEVMDFTGAASGGDGILEKIALFSQKTIDGHCPGLTGKGLQAYRAAGVQTDHECSTWPEALERLRAGFVVQVRQGSAARNLVEILTGALGAGVCLDRFVFCTDDQHLSDLNAGGSIARCVHMAVELGVPMISALRMASWNAAQAYGLRNRGAVAAGFLADLVILDGPETLNVVEVYKGGCAVSAMHLQEPPLTPAGALLDSVRLPELAPDCLALRPQGRFPVMGVVQGELVTTKSMELLPVDENGCFRPEKGLLKLAVIRRHGGPLQIGVGAVRGYGITGGAVASTVAHDSHNLVVVGENDSDMLLAAETLRRCGGGYTAVRGGKVLYTLALPVAGLFAEDGGVGERAAELEKVCREMGVPKGLDVFQNLSFMSLTVIPELRVTDRGVFDVLENRFYANGI